MLARVFMLFTLERGVLDVYSTMLAPILGLEHTVSTSTTARTTSQVLTVDFQCSDIVNDVG